MGPIIKLEATSFSANRLDADSRFPIIARLAKGTLRVLIREAGLTKEQFAELKNQRIEVGVRRQGSESPGLVLRDVLETRSEFVAQCPFHCSTNSFI